MTAAKVYLDEDVHVFIAAALRLRGWEALTTLQAGRAKQGDREQIRFASEAGHAILTYNITDFPRLHAEMLSTGESHGGILVATQEDPRRTVRGLLNIVATFSAEDLRDQLLYVNNWA